MDEQHGFLYVCVMVPSRRLYYYCEAPGGHQWTPFIQQARVFRNTRSLAPIRAARSLNGDCSHRYVKVPVLGDGYV